MLPWKDWICKMIFEILGHRFRVRGYGIELLSLHLIFVSIPKPYTSIIGVILMHYTSKKNYEAEVMFVWSLILSFLLLMLIVKNPFELIWNTFPKDLQHTGPLPPDAGNYVWLDQAKSLWAQFPIE